MNPEIIEKSVVLPAPFGPMSAVMRPSLAVSDAALTASKPPKRQVTRSTASKGSTMLCLSRGWGNRSESPQQHVAQMRESADQAAWHEPDNQHQHRTIDNEIETGSIAGQ